MLRRIAVGFRLIYDRFDLMFDKESHKHHHRQSESAALIEPVRKIQKTGARERRRERLLLGKIGESHLMSLRRN